jgi:GNAT superfamily N-acetyltransferase
MKLILRPAIPSDAPALTDIYFSAFSSDDISLLCFPRGSPSVYAFWYDSIIDEMKDPNSHFLCIVDEDAQAPASPTDSTAPTQRIIAYAKWVSPAAPLTTNLPTWPAGSDTALANHFFGNLVRSHERIMGGRKHWYLELVATRPESQRKGAAGMLLRWGLQRADAEGGAGVEAYLEASPEGKPVYEHFGFREMERLVVLEGRFVECMMVRGIKGVVESEVEGL